MILKSSIGTLISTSILVITVVIGLLARELWLPLMWYVFIPGVLLVVCLMLWFETASAVAVVNKERHLGRVLRYSINLIMNEFIPFVGLMVITLSGMSVLLLFQRWISATVPISWWLLSMVILQALAFARHGLRLFRQSSEVTLTQMQAGTTTS